MGQQQQHRFRLRIHGITCTRERALGGARSADYSQLRVALSPVCKEVKDVVSQSGLLDICRAEISFSPSQR